MIRVRIYDTISKTWSHVGHVIEFDGPRSYIVKTDNGSLFKRNRVHLKPVVAFNPSFGTSPNEKRHSYDSKNANYSLSAPSSEMASHSESLSVNGHKQALSVHGPEQALSVPARPNQRKRLTCKPNRFNDYIID